MVAFHMFLKFAGTYAATQAGVFHAFMGNPWLWCALLILGAGLIFWLMTLRNMSLAATYPWTALIYVITPLTSFVIFDDLLSVKYVLGMVCIIVGVFLTTGTVVTK